MPFYNVDICDTIRDDFLEYAGHVMQERSIPDARDGLKDGARKILYSQYYNKNDYKHNFIKGQAAVGRVLIDGFLHGDASAYSTLVRMGKPYAVPYVLEEIQGNGGNQTNPDSHAAGRYLEIRQSELASYLFMGIEKNAINEWYWNYSNTLELPRVLPTIGFYPIVNGLSGISVGLSTSIPSTNLREVNAAIIKLIQNSEIEFDEIYCAPDFPMGGIITNGTEVKESMKHGTGKAVKIRAQIDYIPDKNMLVATQIPFSVYTDTIDSELTELINGSENPGIEKYIDATNDKGARINIYLSKGVNVKRILNILYQKTSLESYYGINFIMLENGRFPRLYSWKESLLAYIDHIRICERNIIQFDLDKAIARKNIVDGLIKAYSIIDEVVSTIRSSSNPSEAASNLISQYGFNEEQAKAILAMKLASLTKLDIVKLNNEREELVEKIEYLQHLLKDPIALDNELIKILREVADKFGDERRTKVIDLVEEEPVEDVQEEPLNIMLFSDNSIRLHSENELKGGKKGRQGTNIKPPKNASLIKTLSTTNLSSVVAFTSSGKYYSFTLSDLEKNKDYSLYELIPLQPEEKVKLLIDSTTFSFYNSLITISKKGFVKRTLVKDYNMRMKKGVAAVKLEENDDLIDVVLSQSDDDKLFICSNTGNYNFYSVAEIPTTARTTRGLHGIKLKENEFVIGAALALANIEYKGIFSISTVGKGKLTSLLNFPFTSKNVKGSKIMEIKDEEVAAIAIIGNDQKELGVFANNKLVVIDLNSLGLQGRTTMGTKIIDTKNLKTKIEIALR